MKILASIILVNLLIICTSSAQQYKITVALNGFPNQTKFFLKDLSLDINVDSAILINRKFVMAGKISSVKNFWLYTNANKKLSYTNLLIGADQILVNGDRKDFPRSLSIIGSSSQDVANKLNFQTDAIYGNQEIA